MGNPWELIKRVGRGSIIRLGSRKWFADQTLELASQQQPQHAAQQGSWIQVHEVHECIV